jgi:NADPH:quinone reductase-like Zn-dependent oxidoreductase
MQELGADQVVIADAAAAPQAASKAARDGIDVFVDMTGHAELAALPAQLNPRGRVLMLTGRGRRRSTCGASTRASAS